MNVVEKEVPLQEGREALSSEAPSPLKVAKPSMLMANGHPARTPNTLEPRSLSQSEVRRFISERSQILAEFVAPLEAEIRKVVRAGSRVSRSSRTDPNRVAELVLSTIRKITHRETGIFSLDPNVPMLLSALYAGSVEAAIVSGLVRRAQAALSSRSSNSFGEVRDGYGSGAGTSSRADRAGKADAGHMANGGGEYYDLARELEELTMLLKWYVRRKTSLASLDVEQLRVHGQNVPEFADESQDEDALFSFEVLHDHRVFGAKGCFVTCGVRLVGRDGQPLWLRVSVFWNGSPVTVRPEWISWSDPGSNAEVQVVSDSPAFCSLVPIRPNSQRLVIDEIRAFVPYAALDLPAGRCDVELAISVVDNDGREILSASRLEGICIPRRELMSSNVPAPHSVGMWPHDVVSGDKIAELRVTAGHKIVGGWEKHTISVTFDLSLFMHAGESVLLECRFLDERGDLVELSSLGIPYVAADLNVPVESVSSYRYRRILHPKGAWAHFRGLCIDIPVEFLLLDGKHHTLTCEVVTVSSDDRVLCGDMGMVSVDVPVIVPGRGETGGHARAGENGGFEKNEGAIARSVDSTVELESIDVDSTWRFDNEEYVRVQVTLCPRNASRQIAELAAGRVGELFAPYRVQVAIEREDGHTLLQAFSDELGLGFKPVTRGVCVEGHGGVVEHSVVVNFMKEEILGWSFGMDGARNQGKIKLFARVTAMSMDGDVLASEAKEFFVKPISGAGGRKVVETSIPAPRIVDLVASNFVQSPRVACRALLNVPRGRFMEEGFGVEAFVADRHGKRRQVAHRKVGANQTAAWVRQQMGLSQIPVEFDFELGSGAGSSADSPETLEVRVVSAAGELVHSAQQSVQVAGVFVEPEHLSETGPDFGEKIRDTHRGAQRTAHKGISSNASGNEVEQTNGQHRPEHRGFFSWLMR